MSTTVSSSGVLYENDAEIKLVKDEKPEKIERKIIWKNIVILTLVHTIALLGLFRLFTAAKSATIWFGFLMFWIGGFGITGGVHRLWAHRSYKAKWPVRLFYFFGNTASYQGPILWWARDHRTHHKYSETEADPHNVKRGFFFAHVGWLMVSKHPMVKKMGETIDVSDLLDDPIVTFQFRYYLTLLLLLGVVFPTWVPMYFWGETFSNSFCLNTLRVVTTLHQTWQLNSFAHLWGPRPYDRDIKPRDNPYVDFLGAGEGSHNFHHTFPWDYRGSNLVKRYNFTTWLIEFFAKIGWVYDLKTVSEDVIRKRGLRTGDGTLLQA